MGNDVRHFVEAHRSEEAERSRLLLYENGPCSMCRQDVVKHLARFDSVPDWMRPELTFDANPDIALLLQPPT